MSLQVWVPCDGDLYNRGLAGYFALNVSGTAKFGEGKIARQAVSTNSVAYYYIVSDLIGVTNYSMCAWIKVDETAEYTNFIDAIRIQAETGDTQDFVRVELRNQSMPGAIGSFFVKDTTVGSNTNTYYSVGEAFDATEWTHVALTKDANNASVYVNGALLYSKPCSNFEATPSTLTGYVSIGQNNTQPNPSLVNDFRVYDHCLSAKEVHEIAKGLVFHYPLSMPGMPNLVRYTYDYNRWGSNNGTTYVDGDTTKVISYPTASENTWREAFPNDNVSYSLVRNKTITQSCYVKADSGLSCALNMCVAVLGSATTNSRLKYHNIQKTFTGTGKWEKIYDTLEITDSRFGSGTGTPDFDNCWFSVRPGAWNTYLNGFQLKEYKVEIGDHATPWMPAMDDQIYTELGYDNNIEYDASGYCRNMTKTNISYSSDTARYTTSYVFDGPTGSWLSLGSAEYKFIKDEITVSIWGYMDDWTTMTSANSSGTTMMVSSQEVGGFTLQTINSNYKFQFTIGTGETTNAYKYALSPSTQTGATIGSGWHMFTGTYDGLNVKLYIDGQLSANTSAYTTKTPIHYSSAGTYGLFIGAEASNNVAIPITSGQFFNGKLSDCRIYATCLSADDVLELYNTSASLTNTGILMTNEIVGV